MRSAFSTPVFSVFAILTLLLPLRAWADSVLVGLDKSSPEYLKCQMTACAPYLNVTSICTGLMSDGNFTVIPEVAYDNYMSCVCPAAAFLQGIQKCEECTGEASTYSKKKKQCDEFNGVTHVDSVKNDTSNGTETSDNTDNSATPSDAPQKSSAVTAQSVGFVFTASLVGLAAVLVGVV